MPENEEAALVRQIVEAYRASGIPAKSFRGKPFVCREGGWEGPLDTYRLRATYRQEIAEIERAVRTVVADAFNRTIEDDPLKELFDSEILKDRALWIEIRMSPEFFIKLNFDEHKARLYDGVARQLNYRGDLWEEAGGV